MGFRRRSQIQEGPTLAVDDILFPKVYEDAWGSVEGGTGDRPDLGRARIFLLRMATMNSDSMIMGELRAIVKNQENRTIPALAAAIQMRIFGDRHASFATNPLMQCVRFMLIKSRVHEGIQSDRTRSVMDFFFDPTMERNLRPPPSGEVVVYHYPAGRLKVAIVGGGPTALASAMSLGEKGAGKVEVHMYERRWERKQSPNGGSYVDYPPIAKRRDQVVTLQDSVTTLLSEPGYQALFAGRPERVWPGSANIQIRKVEDRFLKRVQDPEFHGLIHLHTEGVTREDFSKVSDFHVLLGADGAASWVRKSFFHGYENERGRSYALGLAFDRPAGLPWSQPLNVFLTLGQTRYLLNASDFDGRGYLNMQLTNDEWHKMVSLDGQPVHFGRPGCLRRPDGSVPEGFEESQVFAPSEDRESPLWISILDGLKLFGFKEHEVINIVRIPIVVQAVKEGVQQLPPEDSLAVKRPHALVAVAGDAAMTVHFWPGRGLNSGIKSGIALGDELVHALNNGRFIGMPLDAMKEYNDFILKLQTREHDKRSIPILNQSGSPEMLGWLLDKANSVPDNVAIEWLIGAMVQIADRLETRDDWAYEPVANVEPQLRIVLRQLDSMTLKEMAVSFPWPTREMAGAEVLPIRSMKPEEKQKWLQNLWGILRDDKSKKGRPPSRSDADRRSRSPSSSRFEAPRSTSPLPPSSGLRRTNATQSVRHGRELAVPNGDDSRARSPSPSPTREVSLGRMLTVHRKPPENVLSDALSLALFRVQEAT
jgi:2-polyprenyl-6-methoxyphenol hydroxylase-like FAD-dependent oxidoreductase